MSCKSDLKLPPWKILRARNEKEPLDFSPWCESEDGTTGVSMGDYGILGEMHRCPLFDYKAAYPATPQRPNGGNDLYGTISAWKYKPSEKWDHYERTFQKLEMRRPHSAIVCGFTLISLRKYVETEHEKVEGEQIGFKWEAFLRKLIRLHQRVPVVFCGNRYNAAEFIYSVCAMWWKDNGRKQFQVEIIGDRDE